MTGMERNSDVVLMASYAPLFANVSLHVTFDKVVRTGGGGASGD